MSPSLELIWFCARTGFAKRKPSSIGDAFSMGTFSQSFDTFDFLLQQSPSYFHALKTLVTGATGFIGSAFARLALSRGHSIGGMMLPAENPPAHVPVRDRMIWIKGTLAELLWREIEAFKPDACIHFAWIATPGVYLESPENEKHLEWSLNLARRLKGIGMGQFVGVGNCIEYKITDSPLNEDTTPVDPTALFPRCKNALRETLEAEACKDGSHFC